MFISSCYRLLVCTLPKDPYNTSDIAGLWAGQPLSWYHKEQNSHVFQVCLPERAAPVHITLKAESMLSEFVCVRGLEIAICHLPFPSKS